MKSEVFVQSFRNNELYFVILFIRSLSDSFSLYHFSFHPKGIFFIFPF